MVKCDQEVIGRSQKASSAEVICEGSVGVGVLMTAAIQNKLLELETMISDV